MWYINIGKCRHKFCDLHMSKYNESFRSRTSSCTSLTTLISLEKENAVANSNQLIKADEVIDVVYQGNTATFLVEVMESMLVLLESEDYGCRDKLEKLKVEINSSKLAYNINTDDLAKNIFLAFLSLPIVNESFAQLSKVSFYMKYICILFSVISTLGCFMEELL